MAKGVSSTAIGGFVVASLAILIVAIVVVGSGRLFQKPVQFICMFQGDLNGLKVGAPVKVRGVQIGSVASIRLRLTPAEGRLNPQITQLRLPVIIDLDRSQLVSRGATGQALGRTGFDDLINRGMRAQLQTESLLTGLRYIDLDLHPGTALDYAIVPGSGPYREIPTVPTQLEAAQAEVMKAVDKLGKIDLNALVASITTAANSINTLVSSPSVKATMSSLQETTANLNTAVVSITTAIDNFNGKIDPLVASLHENSQQVNATLKETQAALVGLQATLDPDSPLAVHLNETLDQLTETSRSVGALADFLQQNPSSLVRGRYVPDKAQ